MKIYKIRNKKTGLFSTGGRYAHWGEKGKTWNSRENAQKAIDWYARDEIAFHKQDLEDYKEDCANVKKHNARHYNVKSGNVWPMPDKLDRPGKLVPFYKDAEIVEFVIKEAS